MITFGHYSYYKIFKKILLNKVATEVSYRCFVYIHSKTNFNQKDSIQFSRIPVIYSYEEYGSTTVWVKKYQRRYSNRAFRTQLFD